MRVIHRTHAMHTRACVRRRKRTTVTIDGKLLERARHAGAAWLRKNSGALKAYNQHIEKHGVFGDGLRSF